MIANSMRCRSGYTLCAATKGICLRPHARARIITARTTDSTTAPGLAIEPWSGSAAQLKALHSLKERLKDASTTAPSDEVLQWYLRDRYFDVDEAEGKLRSLLRWQKEFEPKTITEASISKELNTGKAHVHAHPDVYGRPAIVIRVKRHVIGQFPVRDSKRLCVYLLDKAISQLPPGKEQILGVFDLRDFTMANADFAFAAFMIEAFFEYYPRRVGQVLMVDAPWVFQPAWQVIRPLLRKYAALVAFVSRDEIRSKYFTPETAPPDFR